MISATMLAQPFSIIFPLRYSRIAFLIILQLGRQELESGSSCDETVLPLRTGGPSMKGSAAYPAGYAARLFKLHSSYMDAWFGMSRYVGKMN